MPYSADLRASYFTAEMNKSWVYESLTSDYQFDFTFIGDEAENENFRYDCKIDEWFRGYTKAKLFDHDPENEYKDYESVWDMFYEKSLDYITKRAEKHPDAILIEKMRYCLNDECQNSCDYDGVDIIYKNGKPYCEQCIKDVCVVEWCNKESFGTYGVKNKPLCKQHKDELEYCMCGEKKPCEDC